MIDEFLGMYLILIIAHPSAWWAFLLAFIAFRILDGAKPWPVSALDAACKNWWGVVADDLVVGVVIGGAFMLATMIL